MEVSKEELKAIEDLKNLVEINTSKIIEYQSTGMYYNKDVEKNTKDIATVLNLIEKQQKQIENSIGKDKINNKLIELVKKLAEPNDNRWEKDDDVYYEKIKAQINVLKDLKGE